jgi:dolichol-phosphate mannosyltransferase
MDADGSHEPEALGALIMRLRDADLVIGSRVVPGGSAEGWAARRTLLSRLASAYCRILLGWRLTDPTSGFRVLGPRALAALAETPIRSEGFAFQIEVAYRVLRAGLRVVEHPIRFRDRATGRSKLSLAIVAEALIVVPLLRLCAIVGV